MAIKNYYLILGIPRSESQDGIRSAYRRLAKKYHPDKTGEGESRSFRDIHEAYQTLSDPKKRKGYNLRLQKQEGGQNRPDHDRHASSKRSDFVQNRRTFFDSSQNKMGRREDIFDDFFNRLFGSEAESYHQETNVLEYDVYLTPLEAKDGVRVELRFPLAATCPDCEGTGENWPFSCSFCEGSGIVGHWQNQVVNIPAGSANGTKYRISIPDGPEKYLHLILHVHIISP